MISTRKHRLLKYSWLFAILGILSQPLSPALGTPLPGEISRQLQKYGIPLDAVSLEIREVATNTSLLQINGDRVRNPASVIKLLTTLSALEILGPDFQWHSRYYASGKLKGDVIEGDLVFQGGGDPFLTVERFWHHILSIRQKGVRTITGNLIIDNSLFDIPPHNRSTFDNQPTRLYNVGPDAALVNFSATRFIIQPITGRIEIYADPPLADLVIRNNIKAEQGKCKNKNNGWTYGIEKTGQTVYATFNGSFPVRCGEHAIPRSLFSNAEYAFRLFKYLWLKSGGNFDGGYRIDKTPEQSLTLLDYTSDPLADIITSINKYSNNVMTRNLLLTLDAQREDSAATLPGARKMLSDWLVVNGLSMPRLYVDNGSGLSRKTRITSKNLSDLLVHGWNSNYHPEFLSSLSLSALDGTMRKRLHDSGLQGRARIKTGLINGVRSMAGYVHSRKNKQYTIAMMIESGKVNYWSGNEIQDAVLKWIYNLE